MVLLVFQFCINIEKMHTFGLVILLIQEHILIEVSLDLIIVSRETAFSVDFGRKLQPAKISIPSRDYEKICADCGMARK